MSDKQTLSLWHAWQGAARALLDQWVRSYMHKHTGVQVEVTFIPLGSLGTRFAEATTAGTGPDLVLGPTEWLGRWAAEGLIRRLDDILPQTLRTSAHPVAWDAVSVENRICAVPLTCSTLALYYNRRILPALPPSFNALKGAARAAAAMGKVGLVFNMSLQWAASYLPTLGGALMDVHGDPAINDAAGRAWLARMAGVYRAEGVSTDYKGDAFVRGEAAMIVDGPWHMDAYRAALGASLGVAVLPPLDGRPAAPWVRTENAYVSAAIGGSKPALAMNFLMHVLGAAAPSGAALRAGLLPVDLDAVPPTDAALRVFAEQAAGGVPFPNRPEMEAYWAPMQNALYATVQGGMSTTDALKNATADIAARIAAIRANLPATVYPSFAPAEARFESLRSVAMPDEPIFPFVLQKEITYTSQSAHPRLGCRWQGIAGEMRSMDGQPMTRVIMVNVRGNGLNTFVVAGTATEHGPGGWEVFVGEDARADIYHVTLMHTNGELLSETFRVRFPGNCQGTLARLDFKQVKPL